MSTEPDSNTKQGIKVNDKQTYSAFNWNIKYMIEIAKIINL